jgi:hypothetical protein
MRKNKEEPKGGVDKTRRASIGRRKCGSKNPRNYRLQPLNKEYGRVAIEVIKQMMSILTYLTTNQS